MRENPHGPTIWVLTREYHYDGFVLEGVALTEELALRWLTEQRNDRIEATRKALSTRLTPFDPSGERNTTWLPSEIAKTSEGLLWFAGERDSDVDYKAQPMKPLVED